MGIQNAAEALTPGVERFDRPRRVIMNVPVVGQQGVLDEMGVAPHKRGVLAWPTHRAGALGRQAGFDALWISDHYHPCNDEQGEASLCGRSSAPFPSLLASGHDGGDVPDGPHSSAIVAQAAATGSVLLDGRLILGVGSGEALDEHVTAAPAMARCSTRDSRWLKRRST